MIPGKTVQKQIVEAENALYIAFFYAWLRLCSRATQKMVAHEIKVDDSSVTRWLKDASPELTQPFPKVIGFILPIFFSEDARKKIGMYAKNIRCFPGPYEGETYQNICNIKTALWRLYQQLILALKNYDYILSKRGENLDISFTSLPVQCVWTLKTNEELGLKSKKTLYSFKHRIY